MRLFVKTWAKDFQWLKVAMVSVQNHCNENVMWDIVLDDGTFGEFQKVLEQVQQIVPRRTLNVRVHETSHFWKDSLQISNGYLRQQWIKMTAHRVMGSGYFWNWDSDVLAQKNFTIEDFICHSKPIHWITQFNAIMDGADRAAHEARKQMLRDIFGLPDISFEYMRCMPMPMMGEILQYGEKSSYWKQSLNMLISGDGRFSEFNVLGMYSHLYFPDVYEWRNTQNYDKTFSGPWGDKNYIVSQGYSWGGLSKEIYDQVISK